VTGTAGWYNGCLRNALPDQGHIPTGTSGKYWLDAHRRYFQEHLKP
jgi:hypothetical protein